MQAPARPDEDRRGDFEHAGWSAAGNDPLMAKVIGARMGNSWSLLTGRITYEDFARVWPNRPANPFTEALRRTGRRLSGRRRSSASRSA